jgi:beta-glucosidase
VRDPMAGRLWAADNDDYAGMVPTDQADGRDAVGAAVDGGWLAFTEVDFGSGPTAVTARVAHRATDAGSTGSTLTLRLDDPLAGPVAGTLPVPATGGRQDWADVRTELRGVSGIRDLYLLFSAAGATVSYLSFAGATRGGPAGDKDGGA